ncbi:MAG TPA: asparagine synthase (glutamine-hydrolyzing) [Planctomycetota bacterium]|nr:asparagine synthase (glutamine-hydrolyzing) [Planctomycetota bacterium]
MCGIAGIFSYGPDGPLVDNAELVRMRDRMASRGPDGAGLWRSEDGRIALAHRRLAILDPSPAGVQPMSSPDGSLVIVFNGEIYNYRELRRDLEKEGAVFRTQTDTEVLLNLYARDGERMVERLRGMYAFALWNARTRTLLLARDPFGIKPLYLADDGHTLRFASQVKAIAAGGRVSMDVSAPGITGFFIWGHVPEPWTWLKAVRPLPAGSCLQVREGAPLASPRRHFDLREEILAAEESSVGSDSPAEQVLEALRQSVRFHMVSDVPVGLFLSAGKDSNLIAAFAVRECKTPLRTVTLSFDEYKGTVQDESTGAAESARLLGTVHHEATILRPDFEQERDRLLECMDQPTIDGVNTYFVSRAASRIGLKVALSGLGGDELFGGYSSYRQVPRLHRYLRAFQILPGFGRGVRWLSSPLFRRTRFPKVAGLIEYGSSFAGAYLLRRALYMPWELRSLLDPGLLREGLSALDLLRRLEESIRGIRTPALKIMLLEMTGYMRNQLLRDADWAGMAHSLEIRVPFIDISFFRAWLRFARVNLPFDREALLRLASPDLWRVLSGRPKTGFSLPVQAWTRGFPPRRPCRGNLRIWAQTVARTCDPALKSWRIAMLVTDAYGGIGGIAKFNRDLLAALAGMTEVSSIVAIPRLIQREPEPIPDKVVFDRAAAQGKVIYALRTLKWALSRTRFDLVLCGHLNLLPLAWVVSRMHGCPLAVVVHGVEAWRPHPSSLVRNALQRIRCVIAVSRHTIERMRSWCGLSRGRLHVLPNCVDLKRYTPRPRNLTLAQRYNLTGKRVLLTVGRLAGYERYKGFDETLEVLPDLIKDIPDIAYVIVGDGDDRPRLERKAMTLGVGDRVVFTGYVSEEEKLDLYNIADVFVMPSRGEGFGIVYLEAMACGVPVIGSRLDGSREALRDGMLGRLVDPGNPQELVGAIKEALSLPRGRPAGLEYFSVEAYRNRVGTLVRDLVERA